MVDVWANEPDDTYKLKTLKEFDIKKAEKFFGINLPKDYIEILKHQNGGKIIFK